MELDVVKALLEKHQEKKNRKTEILQVIKTLEDEYRDLSSDIERLEITLTTLKEELGIETELVDAPEQSDEEPPKPLPQPNSNGKPQTGATQFVVGFIRNKQGAGATTDEIFSALQNAGFNTTRKSLHTILSRQKDDIKTIKKMDGKFYAMEDSQLNLV